MAWLDINPPRIRQWYETRNRSLTGCTVLHTAESIMDTVDLDTGAENVARYIQGRTSYGSYHDLVDSDSAIYLVDYSHGAYHDGTGSNNWALSISFACRTTDWARMSPARRAAFLRQGALRFVAQQKWRQARGAPLTRVRRITKAQSDAGESGFIYHGDRDPGRRSDPGSTAAAPFPFLAWAAACRTALGQLMPDHPDATAAGPAPAPPPAPPSTTRPTLREGSRGTHVWDLQRHLTRVYPSYSKWTPTGYFGPLTKASVQEFQRRSGLLDDGIVGTLTWRKLGL